MDRLENQQIARPFPAGELQICFLNFAFVFLSAQAGTLRPYFAGSLPPDPDQRTAGIAKYS
jgi:hypothetical protein